MFADDLLIVYWLFTDDLLARTACCTHGADYEFGKDARAPWRWGCPGVSNYMSALLSARYECALKERGKDAGTQV